MRLHGRSRRARRVVVLASLAEDHPEMKLRVAAFREGLERLGWSEGRNVRIDYRFASAPNTERALPLAKELLALRIAGFFKGAETSRRKRAIATLSGLVGALTLARGVDDPALRRKSWLACAPTPPVRWHLRGCAMIKSAANPGRALPGNLACRG